MPLPVIVIAEMLGVDPNRKEDFKRWSDDTVSLSFPFSPQNVPLKIERKVKSRQEFHEYFREEIIEARRLRPGSDLITALIKANEESDALTADEILGMTVLLLVAGNETTTNLIANAVRQLLQRPDVEARLRATPN